MLRRLTGGPWVVIAMLAVAFLLRAGLVASTTEYVPSGDAVDYDLHARYLVDHGTFPPSPWAAVGSPTAFRPPAWPYLLAGSYEATGGRWTVGRLDAAALGTLAVLLVYLVASEAMGAAVGRIAGWLAAVFPPMFFLSGSLVAENLFVPLVLLAAWATLRARRSQSAWRWAVAAGAACGLATLTRTNGAILLLAVGAGLLAGRRDRGAGRLPPARALALPALAVVAAVVVIAPWTVRNAAAFGTFEPVSTQSGYTVAAVFNPLSDRDGPDRGRPQYGTIAPLKYQPGTDEVDLDHTLGRMGWRYARGHPGYALDLLRLNLLRSFKLASSGGTFTYYWNRERDMTAWRRPIDSAGLALVVALTLLAVLRRDGRRRFGRAPWWLWLFPLLTFASTVLLLGNPRYRASVDPFLVMAAAAAIASLAGARSRRVAPG